MSRMDRWGLVAFLLLAGFLVGSAFVTCGSVFKEGYDRAAEARMNYATWHEMILADALATAWGTYGKDDGTCDETGFLLGCRMVVAAMEEAEKKRGGG